jgi:triosephosphate isomerase
MIPRKIFAANWKMHLGPQEVRGYAERFLAAVAPRGTRDLVFFPASVSLEAASVAFDGRGDIQVGIQDVHWEAKGAFTGAVSVPMAKAAGATCALIGHSERRHVFGESDEDTGRKLRSVLAGGLTPFLCVGEKLEEREAHQTEAVVLRQLRTACAGIAPADLDRMVVAYEPVWAIGTGRNATPDDAALVHRSVRGALDVLGARHVPVLYGGSVNGGNITGLLARPEINGVLVGGASLDPAVWADVIHLADSVIG